jgi:deoxyadenosine/deoxycytidine kinase
MTVIAIEGLMGAGKSSVLRELQKRGIRVITEPTQDWTYLDKFYANRKKYALTFQIEILLSFLKYKFSDELVVVERSPQVSRSVFAKMLSSEGVLSDEDMATYVDIYDFAKPWEADVYIMLECPMETCLERLGSRGDSYNISPEYIADLKKYYDIFMKYNDHTRVNSDRRIDEVVGDIMKLISKVS